MKKGDSMIARKLVQQIMKKAARGPTVAELRALAKTKKIKGFSKMSKVELENALRSTSPAPKAKTPVSKAKSPDPRPASPSPKPPSPAVPKTKSPAREKSSSSSALPSVEAYFDLVLIGRKPHRAFKGDPIPDGYTAIDVTSNAKDDYWTLSPFCRSDYPRLDVPGMPGVKATCVEDVWQGLKVSEEKPMDMAMVRGETARPKKRRLKNIKGHQYGNRLLNMFEAREKIFMPVYEQHLQWRPCANMVNKLRDLIVQKEGKVVLLDYTNSPIWEKGAMSHAWVLKNYLFFNETYPVFAKKELMKWFKNGKWTNPYEAPKASRKRKN